MSQQRWHLIEELFSKRGIDYSYPCSSRLQKTREHFFYSSAFVAIYPIVQRTVGVVNRD